MKKENILLYVILFPVFFQIITYYGFQSSYYNYRDEVRPTEWYYKGIYGYRLLSREIVDMITLFMEQLLSHEFPLRDYAMKKGTAYYHALFLYNTFFAVMVSLMANAILKRKRDFPEISEKMRLGIVFFLAAVSGFSQYVIVHYDNSAVFLLLLGFYFTLNYYRNRQFKDLLSLSLIILVSTLNRETSCLNISFLAALFFAKIPTTQNGIFNAVKILTLPVVAFLLPYFVLRLIIPQNTGDEYYFFESITLQYNLTGINQITGWLFGLLLLKFVYFYALPDNRKIITRFLVISIPYILMIFLVGILWEIRLFVPLVYGAVALAFFRFSEKNEYNINPVADFQEV
ncbi:MAG: hypothetical protein QM564_05005 [Bergeyella sp.]